jgi:hypothetical protein
MTSTLEHGEQRVEHDKLAASLDEMVSYLEGLGFNSCSIHTSIVH